MDRTRFDIWAKAGSKDFTTRARATVQEILKEHQPDPLPSDIRSQIDIVVDEASEKVG